MKKEQPQGCSFLRHGTIKFQFIALLRTVILSERSESKDPYSLQKGNGFFDFTAYRRLRSE